ncbi:hypothetical protein PIB30_094683, partial [Stylosanthes scabra]|nr:hypothetical protein [Stylosanthes scabra]
MATKILTSIKRIQPPLTMISQECNNAGVKPPYDDPMNPSSEPCPLNSIIEEVPDHSHISDDEIPRADMCFDSLEEAHDFYKNYAEKVGFVIKIRNTNHVTVNHITICMQ